MSLRFMSLHKFLFLFDHRVWMFLQVFIPIQAQHCCCQYQHNDESCTVQEEFVRQEVDDRVCGWIKQPEVVAEYQLMKPYK